MQTLTCPVRREVVEHPDALHRWDRAYQLLVQINGQCNGCMPPPAAGVLLSRQEAQDEVGSLCSCIDPATGPDPDD